GTAIGAIQDQAPQTLMRCSDVEPPAPSAERFNVPNQRLDLSIRDHAFVTGHAGIRFVEPANHLRRRLFDGFAEVAFVGYRLASVCEYHFMTEQPLPCTQPRFGPGLLNPKFAHHTVARIPSARAGIKRKLTN